METLRKEGISIDEKLEKQVSELEENIIKKEILPVVTETIEPALKQVQRELVLVVDYHPGLPVSVSLSRKANIAQLIDAKLLEADPQAQHKEGKKGIAKSHVSPKTGLCVYLPDGSFIQEPKACDTFIKAIQLAGVMQVRELGMSFCHVPLVSNTIDAKYGRAQHPVGNGLYVLTHSSTAAKKQQLDRISKALKLKWKVDIIS
jgi:hypothetical protein